MLWRSVVRCIGPAGFVAGSLAGAAAGAAEIVALGASNTYGRGQGSHHDGVDKGQAFPAQLQAMLAARNCKATVVNAGVPGDTTAGMLAREAALLQSDTKVLILQPGGNDERKGQGDNSANIAKIKALAASKGVKVVMLDHPGKIAGGNRLPDGQHFSAAGHTLFAQYLLPKVLATGVCKR